MTAALAENNVLSADRYCLAEEMGGFGGCNMCRTPTVHTCACSHLPTYSQLPRENNLPGDVIPEENVFLRFEGFCCSPSLFPVPQIHQTVTQQHTADCEIGHFMWHYVLELTQSDMCVCKSNLMNYSAQSTACWMLTMKTVHTVSWEIMAQLKISANVSLRTVRPVLSRVSPSQTPGNRGQQLRASSSF